MSKNKDTQRIPVPVDEGFIKLHPGVVALADENSDGMHTLSKTIKKELESGLIDLNPLIIGYPATNSEAQGSWPHGSRHVLLAPLFVKALARKCA